MQTSEYFFSGQNIQQLVNFEYNHNHFDKIDPWFFNISQTGIRLDQKLFQGKQETL